MKTNKMKRGEAGAVVVTAALCIFGVCTLLVVGYLWLVMGQGRSVQRSQTWNQAMTVAEAGVEEALAQLNWGPAPGKGDLSANGWGKNATKTAGVDAFGPPGQRALAGGYYYSSFTAPLNVANGSIATIYSTGYVSAAVTGTKIARRVMVTATFNSVPTFPDAIDVVSNFSANGSGFATDSWNSHTNTLSTNGQYDSSKTTTNGNVGAEYGIVDLGNHKVDGNLYLGPDATYNGSSSDVVGAINKDYNVQIPDVQLPNVTWQDAVHTNVTSVTTATNHGVISYLTNTITGVYDFNQSGNYRITAAGGSYPIQIEPGVTVTLDIQQTTFNPGTVTILGGPNNSGTVYMYQESGSASLAGNTTAGGYRPENFIYYGLPGVTSVTLSGNSAFIGAIYAPEATLTLNGGGGNNGIMGALVVQSLTLHGHYNVHYDQGLAGIGGPKGFTPTSWREF